MRLIIILLLALGVLQVSSVGLFGIGSRKPDRNRKSIESKSHSKSSTIDHASSSSLEQLQQLSNHVNVATSHLTLRGLTCQKQILQRMHGICEELIAPSFTDGQYDAETAMHHKALAIQLIVCEWDHDGIPITPECRQLEEPTHQKVMSCLNTINQYSSAWTSYEVKRAELGHICRGAKAQVEHVIANDHIKGAIKTLFGIVGLVQDHFASFLGSVKRSQDDVESKFDKLDEQLKRMITRLQKDRQERERTEAAANSLNVPALITTLAAQRAQFAELAMDYINLVGNIREMMIGLAGDAQANSALAKAAREKLAEVSADVDTTRQSIAALKAAVDEVGPAVGAVVSVFAKLEPVMNIIGLAGGIMVLAAGLASFMVVCWAFRLLRGLVLGSWFAGRRVRATDPYDPESPPWHSASGRFGLFGRGRG